MILGDEVRELPLPHRAGGTELSGTPEAGKNRGNGNLHDGRWDQAFHALGRNRRTVWSVPMSVLYPGRRTRPSG